MTPVPIPTPQDTCAHIPLVCPRPIFLSCPGDSQEYLDEVAAMVAISSVNADDRDVVSKTYFRAGLVGIAQR